MAASERLSGLLDQAGLDHRVLNARQDAAEAAIIAQAGRPGQITVATNMAGRGTDIKLAAPAIAAGGLHVIAAELLESRRLERQLFGRGARQGDPGSGCQLLALDDELLALYCPRPLRVLAGWLGNQALRRLACRAAQAAAERHHARLRRELLAFNQRLDSLLAFSDRS